VVLLGRSIAPNTIPTPALPLKGREKSADEMASTGWCDVANTMPTPALPLKGRETSVRLKGRESVRLRGRKKSGTPRRANRHFVYL
jgi:hypothetical protein